MLKNGRVEIGKTPSVISGKPCECIKNGEPVLKKEAKSVKKIEPLKEGNK